jgi:hypothetical protein
MSAWTSADVDTPTASTREEGALFANSLSPSAIASAFAWIYADNVLV